MNEAILFPFYYVFRSHLFPSPPGLLSPASIHWPYHLMSCLPVCLPVPITAYRSVTRPSHHILSPAFTTLMSTTLVTCSYHVYQKLLLYFPYHSSPQLPFPFPFLVQYFPPSHNHCLALLRHLQASWGSLSYPDRSTPAHYRLILLQVNKYSPPPPPPPPP